MKSILRRLLPLLLAALLLTPAAAADTTPTDRVSVDGYLIHMEDGRPLPVSDETALEQVLPGVWYTRDAGLAAALSASESVLVEPNCEVHMLPMNLESGAAGSGTLVPGDYAEALSLTGEGVRIAVVDSGVDADNLNLQAAVILEGYDYLNDTAVMSDNVGHGTQVAQMIGGDGAYDCVKGIAPQAEIVPLRCFDAREGTYLLDLAQAIRDAVDLYNCEIINLSWGDSQDFQTIREAVAYAQEAGAIVVAAAGNVQDGFPQGQVFYPAAYPGVIGVGSVDVNLQVSPTSQQTEAVCVCARGEAVHFVSGSTIVEGSGTSFAAPAVAATIALAKQLLPTLDASMLAQLLTDTSADLGDAGYDVVYGHGYFSPEVVFDAPWRYVRSTDDAIAAEGWQRSDGGGSVICAAYDAFRHMADCNLTGSAADIFPYRFAFSTESPPNGATLFFLDSGLRPVSAPCELIPFAP